MHLKVNVWELRANKGDKTAVLVHMGNPHNQKVTQLIVAANDIMDLKAILRASEEACTE
jgi:hypothetical protein